MESGSGLNQTNAIKSLLDKWNIQETSLAMYFDITASNSGKFSGAFILSDSILGHSLLWTACRHHVLEIVLCNAVKIVFGSSVSSKIKCFKLLSQKWTSLDLEKRTFHMIFSENVLQQHASEATSKPMRILCDQNSYTPRDDYRELLQLSLYYIDKTSFSTFSFRRPGPHHWARWKSMAIHKLKMLLLKDQLELDESTSKNLQIFSDFIACFYRVNWLLSLLLVKMLYKSLLSICQCLITAKTVTYLYKALRLQLMHHYLDIGI